MNKLLLILVLLLILIPILQCEEIEIPVDKQCHFAMGAIITVGMDIISDSYSLPPYCPFLVVSVVSFGWECFDEDFNWEDISYCYVGFSFGFAIRYLDSLQYK